MSGQYRTLLMWSVVSIALLFGLAVLLAQNASVPSSAPAADTIPPLTPEIKEMLAKSRGFEALISYTDRGFEPREVAIKKGESVRFTNNSSRDLWVASEGTQENQIYPGTSECGASSFDTCRALKPLEFWEFTFNEVGTWLFRNNLDKEKSGVVRVEVR